MLVIVFDEDGQAWPQEQQNEEKPKHPLGGLKALREASMPPTASLRDLGIDWELLRDLNNPSKW